MRIVFEQDSILPDVNTEIYFTTVNHLANHIVPNVFKDFKEAYQYYLHCGFRITMVHADGEFEPLKNMIDSLPGGPLVNISAANEHVPDIRQLIRVVKERCRSTIHGLLF